MIQQVTRSKDEEVVVVEPSSPVPVRILENKKLWLIRSAQVSYSCSKWVADE
jgi:hypothetical protein